MVGYRAVEKKVKLEKRSSEEDRLRTPLPTYSVIPESRDGNAVSVRVPADEVDDEGNLRFDVINERYGVELDESVYA